MEKKHLSHEQQIQMYNDLQQSVEMVKHFFYKSDSTIEEQLNTQKQLDVLYENIRNYKKSLGLWRTEIENE